jgi:phosphoglycerol transferase MdoB-like AlkP superfamily enzyme
VSVLRTVHYLNASVAIEEMRVVVLPVGKNYQILFVVPAVQLVFVYLFGSNLLHWLNS